MTPQLRHLFTHFHSCVGSASRTHSSCRLRRKDCKLELCSLLHSSFLSFTALCLASPEQAVTTTHTPQVLVKRSWWPSLACLINFHYSQLQRYRSCERWRQSLSLITPPQGTVSPRIPITSLRKGSETTLTSAARYRSRSPGI
jgi:hypothetical protein